MPETLALPISTLEWAAKSVGLDIATIAQQIAKKNTERIISGELTFPQLSKFSKITKKPIGFLFLENPPEEFKIDLPDLRTRKKSIDFSPELIETYKNIKYKQEWYRDYLVDIGAAELDFVGKYSISDAIEEIANSIRETLNLDTSKLKAKDIDEYHKIISEKAELARILVFRNRVVKNNTKKRLDDEEFLGFAISDTLAPVIFINEADKTAAKIFTIAHELAHIWIGKSGVTDSAVDAQDKIEIKCNQVATELLVPNVQFMSAWDALKGTVDEKILAIRKKNRVSELVIARLAKENGKISSEEFWDRYNAKKNFFASQKSTGGANAKALFKIRNSKTFMKTVTDLLSSGRISFKEAGMLLNIAPIKVGAYVE